MTEGGPEREVVFVDKQIRSLLLWFPAARGVNPDNDAMLRAASMVSDLVIISMNYNSGGYVMNKADGACGYTHFSRDRMTRLYHSGNSLVRTWYESSIVQEYGPNLEQGRSMLDYRIGNVCIDYNVHAGGRPRTTVAMLFANAVNNEQVSMDDIQVLRDKERCAAKILNVAANAAADQANLKAIADVADQAWLVHNGLPAFVEVLQRQLHSC